MRELEFLRELEPNGREWRFDFAWPDERVAVEIHGGEYSHGAHVRGSGARNDWEKSNAGQLSGWVVLTFGGTDLTKRPFYVTDCIKTALAQRAAD